MRLYLDASAIIYSIESAPPFRDTVLARLSQLESTEGVVLTSRLSRLECRVKPLRESQKELLATYDEFFSRESIRVIEIGPAIVELATDLRVRFGFKTADAIHLATAID
jgi:uncharacterized protein